MADSWSLTESNPAVFSAILWDLGVSGVQVEELYALDASLVESMKPVYAFIFLFKWRDATKEPASTGQFKSPETEHYFALQTISNACASIALLNAVLNIKNGVELGSELESLKSFSAEMDYETRGHVLTNSERLREVHNSFARSDPFALDDLQRDDGEKEDAFHFVVYAPIGDELYEFDGLKPSPVSHGRIPGGGNANWTSHATNVLETRMASYDGGVHFSLMAVVGDRLKTIQNEIEQTQNVMASVADESARADCEMRLSQLQTEHSDEQDKRQRWNFENTLRRHNLTGFAVALLSELAKVGKLDERVVAAKEIAQHKKKSKMQM